MTSFILILCLLFQPQTTHSQTNCPYDPNEIVHSHFCITKPLHIKHSHKRYALTRIQVRKLIP